MLMGNRMNEILPASDPGLTSPPASERGFSVVETLIAAALLLLLIIGVLPLIDQARRNNEAGRVASSVVTFSSQSMEEHLALPFNAEPLTIPGANTELLTVRFLSEKLRRWLPAVTSLDSARVRSEVRVRQYNLSDLLEDGQLDNPLPGTATESFVHLKVIEPALWDHRRLGNFGTPLVPGPTWRVRVVQTF